MLAEDPSRGRPHARPHDVLLAKANVSYGEVFELDDLNSEFGQADVALRRKRSNLALLDEQSLPIVQNEHRSTSWNNPASMRATATKTAEQEVARVPRNS
jgi:hypothetical protein